MNEFVYDYFLFHFGVKRVAEEQLYFLLEFLRKHRDEDMRIRTFEYLLGFNDEKTLPADLSAFASCCVSALHRHTRGPLLDDLSDGTCNITVDEATKVIDEIFAGSESALNMCTLAVMECVNEVTGEVSWDVVLSELLSTYERQANEESEEHKRFFKAGDSNGDGMLSFDEFKSIAQKVLARTNPEVNDRQVATEARRAFRSALKGAEGSSLTPELFASTCRKNGWLTIAPRTPVALDASIQNFDETSFLVEAYKALKKDLTSTIEAMEAEAQKSTNKRRLMEEAEHLRKQESSLEQEIAAAQADNPDAGVEARHKTAAWGLLRRLLLAWSSQVERAEVTTREEAISTLGSAAYNTMLNA